MRLPIKNNKSSGEKKFSAFEFTKDEERVEKHSKKMLSKFNIRKRKTSEIYSPVDKYKFLQFFAKPTKIESTSTLNDPINVDADDTAKARLYRSGASEACSVANDAGIEQTNNSNEPLAVDDSDDSSVERISRSDASVSSGPKVCYPRDRRFEGADRDKKLSNSGSHGILTDIEPVRVDSDDDQNIELRLSTLGPNLVKCGVGSEEDLLEVDDILYVSEKEMMVVINPDYIVYGDMYSMDARLTFSSHGVKLEGSTHFGSKRSFNFEWKISEIVSVVSMWCESVELAHLAELTICFKSKDMKVAGLANKFPGIMKLSFAVSDPHWSEREEAIKSLDSRFKAAWNTVLDIDTINGEEASSSQNGILSSEHNDPNKAFKVIVYPKGDPDAVSISKKDIDLLEPERFINDTIIDFYIKHLEQRIRPTERRRFHFFNSFFFRKLADLDKDSSRAHEARVDIQRVHKWTKKVNLFEKDFIFIPVNFSLHWSLVVICHPGEVVTFRDDESENLLKVPCILHMDSIRGSHRGLRNLFQSYLWEEWKERHDNVAEDMAEMFLNLQFIPLKLPQQQNSFDCGLFLLHYVELFLKMAPVEFNPFNMMPSSSFLQMDWFPPAKASQKRAQIRKLVNEILDGDPREDPTAACEGKYTSPDVSGGNTCIDCRQEAHTASEGYAYGKQEVDLDGVEITTRAATPIQDMCCSGRSSFVFEDVQPIANVVTDKLWNNSSPIKEQKEFGELTSPPWAEQPQCLQAFDVESLPSPRHEGISRVIPAKDFSGIPVNREECDNDECVPLIVVSPSPEKADYVSKSSSMANEEHAACIVVDSDEENVSSSSHEDTTHSFCQVRTSALSLE